MELTGQAPLPAPASESLRHRLTRFYEAHEPSCTAALFVAGFLFDTLFVGRIDKLHNILHQASYLTLCAWLIGLELRELHGRFTPPPRLLLAWKYHAGATHFMLGTLLNIYTLFYFKSASWLTSLIFMAIMASLLAVNELKPFESSGTLMRMSLFSLCLVSYFTYLVPTLVGKINGWLFVVSLACAGAVAAVLTRWLTAWLPEQAVVVRRTTLAPFAVVAGGFALLYFFRLIPPVPLSLERIGIYHDVHWQDGRLALISTRPRWRFWEKGDQTFEARPGDALYCFASVFSPTRFQDKLRVRWLRYLPERGWAESDAIALEIKGGRDEGFRGFTKKTRYEPGRWRVVVETSDGRELGRIGFNVVPDPSTAPRSVRVSFR